MGKEKIAFNISLENFVKRAPVNKRNTTNMIFSYQ